MEYTDSIGYLVKAAQQKVYHELSGQLRAFGLTLPQYGVLTIVLYDPGLSNAELARRAFVTPQTMNEIVAVLIQRGLITRHKLDDNHKSLALILTKEGNQLLHNASVGIRQSEINLASVFDDDEVEIFRSLLQRYARL